MQTSETAEIQASTDGAAKVLTEISTMVEQILGEFGIADVEITADTTFFEDLELESIDLVVLGGQLEARYDSRVNIAEFIATLEFDEIIGLSVGRLADHVVGCLRATPDLATPGVETPDLETAGLEPSAPQNGSAPR